MRLAAADLKHRPSWKGKNNTRKSPPMPRARTDQMSGTEITHAAVISINEVDWIIELKEKKKTLKMKKKDKIWRQHLDTVFCCFFEGTFCSLPESACHFVSIMMNFWMQSLLSAESQGLKVAPTPWADRNRRLISSSSSIFFSLFACLPLFLSFHCLVPTLFFNYFSLPFNSDFLFFYTSAYFLPLSSLGFNWGVSSFPFFFLL